LIGATFLAGGVIAFKLLKQRIRKLSFDNRNPESAAVAVEREDEISGKWN
jgi:hypothetical protein